MYATLIQRTGWTIEYITDVPNLQALRILADSWDEEQLEAQGKTSTPSGIGEKAVDVDSIGMPNVWNGAKEGTINNAESFNRMLFNTK